jgi:transposase
LFPPACAPCHPLLPPTPGRDAPPPRRHQLLELPPVLIQTIDDQCHAACCAACGTVTWATLPPEVPHGIVGPRLQALCALLVGRHRVSRRGLQEVLREAGGEAIARGTLVDLEARTTRAREAPYEQARSAVGQAAVASGDETPWREGSQPVWLGSASTHAAGLFRRARHRSRDAFELLLPPRRDGSQRTVVGDRYSASPHLPGHERPVCWRPRLREFTERSQLRGEEGVLGKGLLAATGGLFERWHACRNGESDRGELAVWRRPVMAQFAEMRERAQRSEHGRAGPLGRELRKPWDCLGRLVRLAGVEPTNKAAERAVRPGVRWRKSSFGNQGASGRAFVERMLTVGGSLRLPGRKVLSYLEAAIRAAQGGEGAPSLVSAATG